MSDKIVAVKIWDISWSKGTEEIVPAVVIDFDEAEEKSENFIDRKCRNFNRWSVSDEVVDKYFRKHYGETTEEFCTEFYFEGEKVSLQRKEEFYGY